MAYLKRHAVDNYRAQSILTFADYKAFAFFKRVGYDRRIKTPAAVWRAHCVHYNGAAVCETRLEGLEEEERRRGMPPIPKACRIIACTSGQPNCYCRSGRTRAIARYDGATGAELEVYCSASDAARKLGLAACSVTHVTNGLAESAGGHHFRYVNDVAWLNSGSRAVNEIARDGSIKTEHPSCNAAANRLFGKNTRKNGSIGECCNGYIDHVDGHVFRWAEPRINGCDYCGSDADAATLLLCDGIDGRCGATAHVACLGLNGTPTGDHFCDRCQERLDAGWSPTQPVPRKLPRGYFKDRRGVTVQQVSLHKIFKDQLRRALVHPQWPGRMAISGLEYRHEPVKLGHLSGNQFICALRNVSLPNSEGSDSVSTEIQIEKLTPVIQSAVDSLKAHGFWNYFGLQRFGTMTVKTHHVGIEMLSKRCKNAVRLIFGDTDLLAENPAVVSLDAAARDKLLKTGEDTNDGQRFNVVQKATKMFLDDKSGDCVLAAKRALDALPHFAHLEKKLLQAIAHTKNKKSDSVYETALQRLPRQSLSLYVHAVQSFFFNKMLSLRAARFGSDARKVQIGDLVLSEGADAMQNVDEDCEDGHHQLVPEVTVVTSENINDFNITDVVLPLPGSEVRYPPNLKENFETLASDLFGAEAGLGIFSRPICGGQIRLAGDYRRIVAVPKDVGFEFRSCASATDDIIKSSVTVPADLKSAEIVERNAKRQKISDNDESQTATSSTDAVDASDDTSNQIHVVFSCKLGSSEYLTMCLREIVNSVCLDPAEMHHQKK